MNKQSKTISHFNGNQNSFRGQNAGQESTITRSHCDGSQTGTFPQKKLISDFRSELSSLKSQFTKLITKPTGQLFYEKNGIGQQKPQKINILHKQQECSGESVRSSILSRSSAENKFQTNNSKPLTQKTSSLNFGLIENKSLIKNNCTRGVHQAQIAKHIQVPSNQSRNTASFPHEAKKYSQIQSDTKSNTNSCTKSYTYSVISNSNIQMNDRTYIASQRGSNRFHTSDDQDFKKFKQQKKQMLGDQSRHSSRSNSDKNCVVNMTKNTNCNKQQQLQTHYYNSSTYNNNKLSQDSQKTKNLEMRNRSDSCQYNSYHRLNESRQISQNASLIDEQKQKQRLYGANKILQIKLKLSNDKLSTSHQQIERLREKLSKIMEQLVQLKEVNEKQQQQITNLRQKNTKIENEQKKKTQWINALSKKCREVQMSKLQIIKSDEEKITKLETQNEKFQSQNHNLKNQLTMKKDQINWINGKKNQIEIQIRQLRTKVVELDKTKKMLEETKIQCKTKDEWVTSLAKKIKQMEVKLQGQSKLKQSMVEQPIEQFKSQLSSQQNKVKHLENKIATLLQKENQQKKYFKSSETQVNLIAPVIKHDKPNQSQMAMNNLMEDYRILQNQLSTCHKDNKTLGQMLKHCNEGILKMKLISLNQKYSRYHF